MGLRTVLYIPRPFRRPRGRGRPERPRNRSSRPSCLTSVILWQQETTLYSPDGSKYPRFHLQGNSPDRRDGHRYVRPPDRLGQPAGIKSPRIGREGAGRGAGRFPPEGDESFAHLVSDAYRLGWKRFICFGHRGTALFRVWIRTDAKGVRIDAYDSTGDYLASGIDGLEIYVHGNAQDQLGQILKSGKLVVYGDVGQTFMYGAKGGDVYVLGNAAGRPLINAAGKPRVIINGTALDFLAESFMAGDPYNGGGFVILNGLAFNKENDLFPLIPRIRVRIFFPRFGRRDIHPRPESDYRSGAVERGEISPFTETDWNLILPYLKENERLFGISIEDHLLMVDGKKRSPGEVYRTIGAVKLSVLSGGNTPMEMNEEWDED